MPCRGFHLLVAATDHELNEPVVKEHLRKPGYFDPTTKWDDSITGRGQGGPWPHFNVDGVWVNERTSDY